MHSGGQEDPNKLLDCVKEGKEKNISNTKMALYILKAQPHLRFWISHHKKRYRKEKKRTEKDRKKIIMDLKRFCKNKKRSEMSEDFLD